MERLHPWNVSTRNPTSISDQLIDEPGVGKTTQFYFGHSRQQARQNRNSGQAVGRDFLS